jgi:hypothetical protein
MKQMEGGRKNGRMFSDPVMGHDPKFEKHWFRILEASLNEP